MAQFQNYDKLVLDALKPGISSTANQDAFDYFKGAVTINQALVDDLQNERFYQQTDFKMSEINPTSAIRPQTTDYKYQQSKKKVLGMAGSYNRIEQLKIPVVYRDGITASIIRRMLEAEKTSVCAQAVESLNDAGGKLITMTGKHYTVKNFNPNIHMRALMQYIKDNRICNIGALQNYEDQMLNCYMSTATYSKLTAAYAQNGNAAMNYERTQITNSREQLPSAPYRISQKTISSNGMYHVPLQDIYRNTRISNGNYVPELIAKFSFDTGEKMIITDDSNHLINPNVPSTFSIGSRTVIMKDEQIQGEANNQITQMSLFGSFVDLDHACVITIENYDLSNTGELVIT